MEKTIPLPAIATARLTKRFDELVAVASLDLAIDRGALVAHRYCGQALSDRRRLTDPAC
jgi:hypothetical protein